MLIVALREKKQYETRDQIFFFSQYQPLQIFGAQENLRALLAAWRVGHPHKQVLKAASLKFKMAPEDVVEKNGTKVFWIQHPLIDKVS